MKNNNNINATSNSMENSEVNGMNNEMNNNNANMNTENQENKSEKKKASKALKIIATILVIILIILLLLKGCSYRYYTPTEIFEKVKRDTSQSKISEEVVPAQTPSSNQVAEPEYINRVSLYSETLEATASNGVVNFRVRNLDHSNQDIVAEVYLPGEVVGSSEEYVCIAKSGAVEPGYLIDTIDIVSNYNVAPGTYKALFKELYYDHTTGELANINGTLEIFLTVN